WLQANHQRQTGLWVVTFKKHCGDKYVAYNDIVEEALCFGWVDSLPRQLDRDRTMLWLAPRQPGSGWSRLNKQRVEKLMAAGKMSAAGLSKIAAAKEDGSWSALDAVENLEIPSDLAAALADCEGAASNFAAFPKSAKRGILEWIANAKRPETRAKRIHETATLAQQNIRANQWRRQ
ncbi:MAG: YdeI/OmpD-associated family protein, partial [Cyanobacteria bacterium P01_D01_bin.71]